MRKASNLNFRQSLFLGTSIAAFACSLAPVLGQTAAESNETVIVTGTRVQGMTAADSATPITVLGTDALSHGVGTTDLRQALGQTVPSFSAQQFANDTAEFSLSAALRGLSPNDTLVLMDGHRRHYTGNLHVDGGNYASGSSSPDISLIPEGAIDHVEVLLEGAAAQYGTDAIAGVVNIILKNKSSGGQLSGTTGEDYSRGGKAYDVSYNMGLPLFDKGFVNVTLDSSITTIPIWAATIRATSTAWASPRRSVQWELHPMRPALSPVQAETVFLLLGLMRPAPATTIPATI